MKNKLLFKLLIVMVVLFVPSILMAQNTVDTPQPPLSNDEPDPSTNSANVEGNDMESFPPETFDFAFDWGGWLETTQLYSTDNWQTATILNLKLYMNFLFTQDLALFVRGKYQFYYFPNVPEQVLVDGDPPQPLYDQYHHYPDVELLYFAANFDGFHFRIGREYFITGRGVVFSSIADGMDIGYTFKHIFDFTAFVNYSGLNIWEDTNPLKLQYQDLATGLPFRTQTNSIFTGGQFTFPDLIDELDLYVFGVFKYDFDEARQPTGTLTQDNYYTAQFSTYYIGAGLSGDLLGLLVLDLEFIYQGGKIQFYENNVLTEKDIVAFSTPVLLQIIIPPNELNFSIDLQFDFATGTKGDSNKLETFIPFGSIDTGFVFRPKLSNMLIARGGFSINPFFFSNVFANFLISARYGYYQRMYKEAAIVSNLANLNTTDDYPSASLGHLAELHIAWRILSDLSFVFSHGLFFPEDDVFGQKDDQDVVFNDMVYQMQATLVIHF